MGEHHQPLTISIVIPAYNEERHLKDCLDAIVHQTERPDEVIVVNNNSIDKTVEIARSYDFVTLVDEPKQGMAHARNRGFAVAKSELLGRIDADTILTPAWVAVAKKAFQDPSIDAISGPAVTQGGPIWNEQPLFPKLKGTFWSKIYFIMAAALLRVWVLWGANMVVRAEDWQVIKDKTCDNDRVVHEDLDIAFLLAGNGYRSKYEANLLIQTGGESYFYWPKFREYVQRVFYTKAYHRERKTLDGAKTITVPYWYSLAAIMLGIVPTICFSVISYLFALPARIKGTLKDFKPAP